MRHTSFLRSLSLTLLWYMKGANQFACSELVMCHDCKEFNLKLTKIPMVEGTKLNLMSMDQMKNEK